MSTRYVTQGGSPQPLHSGPGDKAFHEVKRHTQHNDGHKSRVSFRKACLQEQKSAMKGRRGLGMSVVVATLYEELDPRIGQ